jgi:hypothetical protein
MLFLAANLLPPGLVIIMISISVRTTPTVFMIVVITVLMANAALPKPQPLLPIHTLRKPPPRHPTRLNHNVPRSLGGPA